MVNNAMAAIGAAKAAQIDTQTIQSGLAGFTPVQGRMNLGQLSDKVNLIDDTYNANPASMTQALKTLDQVAGKGQGIAALGDMLELGPNSDQLHREIGYLLAELSPFKVCLFGSQTKHIMAGALEKGYPHDKLFTGTKDEIADALAAAIKDHPQDSQWLLLKGSRGMAMETLIPELKKRITQQVNQQKKEKAD
jgi:murE/murF fusion protein